MSKEKNNIKLTLTIKSFEEAVKVAFNTGIDYSLDLINNGKSLEVSEKFADQFVENLLNKHKENSSEEAKSSQEKETETE